MGEFQGRLCGDRKAVLAIENWMIVALITLGCITALTAVGTSLNTQFNTISTSVTAAGG